ncbi:MAG: purine-binding chemotaxis protein CheW [Candidatus Magnetoglobus multicellularis str. Araruama]|uniref:Purine-binding chemotaxis protein CheW n=1 Tax=Candidatus Magnetoglobus multicellularis str. Araruama TaxID=890399 RepID=A0A1V1P918_9BACT|nr:MAG: purine-binding chemotaxis protein CheW [Candidatus Magnetoglobus multicellularis str. Araruama]
MDNQELLDNITLRAQNENEEQIENAEKINKYLIVSVKDKKYAFHADQIREIVMNVPLYYVPFVPHYIRGFINRHGEPYTVFDLNALFEKEQLDSATFLISKFNNDQIAFLTTSVIEILKIPESEVHLITSTDEYDSFFLGALNSKGTEIFILNLQNIIGRLDDDLGSV